MKEYTFMIVFIICLAMILSFGVTALIIKGICWAFGFIFTWKLAFGIWLVCLLISQCVKNTAK